MTSRTHYDRPARTAMRLLLAASLVALTSLAAGPAAADEVPYRQEPQPGWGVNGTVWAVALGDGVAYVGGDFTQATGPNGTFARQRLAAFDLATGDVTSFRADASGRVRALEFTGDALYVGGDFTTIGGQSRSRLAEVEPRTGGVVTAFSNSTSSSVRSLAAAGDRLYVVGNFGRIAGVQQPNVAAVSRSTRLLDQSFNPVVDGTVQAVTTTPNGSRVFIGGDFRNVDAVGRPYLAALDVQGELLPTDFRMSDNYGVRDLDTNDDGSHVYAAVMGAGNQVAAFATQTGSRLWRQRAEGDVQAVTHHGGNVYFGFHEGFAGDFTVRILAADADTGQLEPTFRPTMNSFYGVWSTEASPAGLLAGGEFSTVSGVPAGRVALFAPTTSPTPGPDPVPPTAVAALSSRSALTIAVDGSGSEDPDGQISSYSWEFGDGSTATGAQASHTYAAGGTYTVTLRVTDDAGLSDSASLQVEVAPPDPIDPGTGPATTSLVAASSSWRYFDQGAAPTQWAGEGFDASSWPQGDAELGYGDGDEATVVSFGSDPNSKHLTTYFRRTLSWDGSHAADSLVVRLVADDGAVVYLNGAEVVRDNMPAGAVGFGTYASTGRWGAGEREWREFSLDPSLLRVGGNVVAVEVHQDYARSSDLSFNLELAVSTP
jgi:hypothetical protein